MDLSSLLEFISNTAIDRVQGTAVFEATGGTSLRVDLSIADRFFRAIFQSGSDSIVVTPGNVLALSVGGFLGQSAANTQPALDAWKTQPPVTLSPVASGLQQLTTGDDTIDTIIQRLANSGGQLAVGIIPTLCWTNAYYPTVELPGIKLTDVDGRICFRDILFNSSELSFDVDLEVACTAAEVALGGMDSLNLQNTNLRLEVAVRYDFPTDEITGELTHLAVRSAAGHGKVQGIGLRDFAASLAARNIRLEKGHLTDGSAFLALAPVQGSQAIAVDLPATIDTPDVTLANIHGGKFSSLVAHVRLLDAARRMGTVELLSGGVLFDVVGIKIGAAGGAVPQVSPLGGGSFAVELRRFRQSLNPDGTTDQRFGICLANPATLKPALRLKFGDYALRVDKIEQVKLNVWNVGEFDTRLGFGLEHATGALEGKSLPSGPIQISDATVRLISDEYGPCAKLPQVARRHAYAQFELQLAGFPKRLENQPFSTGEIPISPSALFHYLGNRIDSDVLKFVLDFIARGYAITGVIDLDVFLVFHGAFTVDFAPEQSEKAGPNYLVFKASLVLKMDVIVRVYGELGICPICLRIQIGDDIKTTVTLLAPSLFLIIEWEFDPGLNRIVIRKAEARIAVDMSPVDDMIAAIAAVIINIYLQHAVVGRSIPLPPEFQVRGIQTNFGKPTDKTVQISLAVAAEKLDWS